MEISFYSPQQITFCLPDLSSALKNNISSILNVLLDSFASINY